MARYLEAIFRGALMLGAGATAVSLVLGWRIRRADTSAWEDVPLRITLGPVAALASASLLVGGGAGLWVAAVSPDPTERATVTTLSVAALVPSLIFHGWIGRALMESRKQRKRTYRWVTAGEAISLLRLGAIDTFRWGSPDHTERVRFSGRRTGVKLTSHDHSHTRHLQVYPEMLPTLEPIAREARDRTGSPRFVVDDKWLSA